MPFSKIIFKPGVNRENTRYTNEGGWYESDKVRFRQGSPEKIGGWTQYSSATFLGVCRSLWNWITLSAQNIIGLGTNLKYYLTIGNQYFDITPIRSTVTLSNPFTATAGSSTITVAATSHGALINDFVTFSGAVGLGGNITAGVLNQQYQITSVPNVNQFTFTATATANSTDASGSPGGGSAVVAAYQVNTGPAFQTPFSGWGAGTWGGGSWGNGQAVKNNLQIWNAYNFGQNLLFGPRGSGLYYWTAPTLSARGVALNTTGGTVTITNSSSTGAPALITSTVNLPNNSSIQLGTTGALPTGLSTSTTYYVVNVLGTAFNVSLTQGGIPISTSSAGSGTQSISLLMDVPLFQNYLQVSDSSNFVIVFGTNDYGSSTLDPMLIRWSDQQSTVVWYPDITNQAGSVRLSHGSQIITAIQTRQEIVVFTDAALYSLQYLGPPYVWGVQLLSENTTIIGPNAAVLASGVIYWMGIDKFYMYDGRVQTLSCDLRRFVFQDMNYYQNEQVYCSTVEGFNEVWWFYVSGTGNQINSYVVYNYIEKNWYYGTMARTAWLDTTLQNNPIAATYNGYLLNQEDGVDDNETGTPAPIDAYISSSEFDVGDGDHFVFIDRILPDLTFSGSTSGTSPITTMTLYALTDSGSGVTQTYNNNVAYTAAYNITEEFTGQVYTRIRGRQMILKMESNKVGTTWQLGAPRFNIRPDGRR
jgi:hypothetical protein